jgi:hypothetical protein
MVCAFWGKRIRLVEVRSDERCELRSVLTNGIGSKIGLKRLQTWFDCAVVADVLELLKTALTLLPGYLFGTVSALTTIGYTLGLGRGQEL